MVKRTIWYVDTGGAVYFWQMIANAWDTGWHQGEMGGAEAISVREQGDVWCLNTRGEVWRSQQSEIGPYQWKQVVEIGPDDVGDIYSGGTYTVKSGDNLWAIVCNEFGLSDPEDTDAISQLVDRIVADNRSQSPHLTRSLIRVGDVLTLPEYG